MPSEFPLEPEARFNRAIDQLFTMMDAPNDSAFAAVFRDAYTEYLGASNGFRHALYEYAKTIANSEVCEVYKKQADDLFTQTPFLISAILGCRKRRGLAGE